MKTLTPCEICGKERYIKPGRRGLHSFCLGECTKEFHRRNPKYLNQFVKSRPGWNKGGTRTEEVKQKIREKLLGKSYLTESGRNRLREFRKGNQYYKFVKNRPKGAQCYNWQGGRRNWKKIIYDSVEYKNWRKKVFERDNYTCQHCGARNGNGKVVYLEADHIKPFALYSELRFDVSNGRTLCRECHIKTPTFSRRIKSREQYEKLIELTA